MSDHTGLQVGMQKREGGLVLTPVGDIGTHEAPSLRTAVKQAFEQRPMRIVVDLAGVSYMATAGLATLVEAQQLARKGNVALVLTGLQERVRAVFEISRLTSVFRIATSLDDALKS